MTAYTPYPKVIFDGGIEYADNTVSNISITLGRRDIFEQPQPGLASIELWTQSDTPLTVNLADSVKIQIKKSDNTYATIYTGQVTDKNISIAQYGETGDITVYSITALGVLSLLNKRLAGGSGYSKEFDGTRIFNILSDAFILTYDDMSALLTFDQVPPEVTFNSFDGSSGDVINTLDTQIDVPGIYELTAYNDGETNALSLAQNAAQSGRGVLLEGPDGTLHYDDYLKRTTYTPITLTANDIQAQGLSTNSQWAEIANQVFVTYRNNNVYEFADGTSQIIYGKLVGTRNTQLENGLDALQQAMDFVDARAYPRNYPESITIPLHSPTVSDATRDALIELLVGRPIYTNELPAVFGEEFNGFVEGIQWRLTRYTADMSLICSDVSETYPHIIWLQVPNNTTWAEYNPSIQWSDL